MRETDKEVLHRMCDKIRLSDTQREDIMKKINEEVTGKKHRSFNVKRFATVMACAMVLVGATIVVGAKINMADKVSNVYTKWQDWDAILGNDSSDETDEADKIVLNEEEKQIIEDLSVEVGYEFEVDGGKIRIDGIMYDSRYIFLMYTAIADDGKMETAADLLKSKFEQKTGLDFVVKGKFNATFSQSCVDLDLDENAEGYQGCFIAAVNPIQHITNRETGERTDYNNFSFSQGDVIILTDRKYHERILVYSLDEIERIYGTLELTKPVEELVFTCENTEGMEVLETVTEIRLSPLSITIMGDELLRKTYPEGIGYTYYERNGRIVKTGATGDEETEKSRGGYAVKVVKKDGTVAEFGYMPGPQRGSATYKEFEYFYNMYTFAKPLDLTEVDHILVWGWGLEYKIPVNVTE